MKKNANWSPFWAEIMLCCVKLLRSVAAVNCCFRG